MTKQLTQAEKLEALLNKAIYCGMAYENMGSPHKLAGSIVESNLDKLFLFDHDFARALFGEPELRKHADHDVPIKRKGAKPEDFDATGYSHVADEHWICTNCHKAWGKTLGKDCVLIQPGNIGWQLHLQQAVISDNPIDYMYEAVFGNNEQLNSKEQL